MAICGIDISHHNVIDDWDALSKTVGFVLIKASQYGTDPAAETHATEARQRSLAVGFYHYLVAEEAGSDQAELYLRSVDDLASSLPVIVDVERGGNTNSSPEQVVGCLTDFLSRIAEVDSRSPIIYTSARDWNELTASDSTFGAETHLWLARYGSSPGSLPAGWSSWLFWQYTDRGRVPGCDLPLDQDIFDGEPFDLHGLIGSGSDLIVPDWAMLASISSPDSVLFEVRPSVGFSGATGERVTAIGRGLAGVDRVLFGNIDTLSFAIMADSRGTAFRASVPPGLSGKVPVSAEVGGTSIESFATYTLS